MRTLASLAVTLLVLACCTSNAQTPGGEAVNFRTLSAGQYGAAAKSEQQARESSVAVATDDSTYRALWSRIIGDEQPPAVDFTKESVVFLALGSRSTGGFAVRPMAVLTDGDTARVNTIVEKPERGGIVATVITSPYAAIAIPRSGIRSVEWYADNDRLVATSKPAR